jgi:putative inorganic carbon (HCO3(-)) transporter
MRSFVSLDRTTPSALQWIHVFGVLTISLAALLAVVLRLPFGLPLIIIGAGAFSLAAFRVDTSLYAAVFFLPIPLRLPEESPVHDATAFVRVMMFLGIFVRLLLEGQPLRNWLLGTWLSRLAVGYGFISLLSALLFNQRSALGMTAPIWLLSYICFYFTIAGWVRTERQMRTIIGLLLLSTIIVALFGFYQAAIGDYGDLYSQLYPNASITEAFWTGRITSFLNYATCLAGYLNLVLPFALACTVLPLSRNLRLLGILCLITATIALVLTQTRGGVFAFAGTLLLGLFLLSRYVKTRKLVAVTVVVALLVSLPILTQLSTRYSTISDDSALGRFAFWDAAWGMFLSSPLIGVGYGNFGGLFELPGEDIRRDVHNIYLQLLAETGVLGFAIFFLLVAVALRLAWRQFCLPRDLTDKVLGFAALGGIISVLTHGLVEYLFNASPQFGTLFWTLLALLSASAALDARGRLGGARVVTT